jgi:uncharacterized membrane protein YdjX (TVP38/TMEM64 family)
MNRYARSRKWLAGISLAVVLLLMVLLTLFVSHWLRSFSQDDFRDYVRSFGVLAPLVMLGLQILQVFIALIPGEIVESAAGYILGPWLGAAVCYLGICVASTLIFTLTRRYGVKLTEVFVSRERINELRFLNTEQKRNTLIFLLFFIPGTPKDLLSYFVGLTDMKLSVWVAISFFARIPSVVTSTLGGDALGTQSYLRAAIVFGAAGLLSAVGLYLYHKLKAAHNARKERRHEAE